MAPVCKLKTTATQACAGGAGGGAPKQSVGTCRSLLPSCLRSRLHIATFRRLRGGWGGPQAPAEQRPAAATAHSGLMHAGHVRSDHPIGKCSMACPPKPAGCKNKALC